MAVIFRKNRKNEENLYNIFTFIFNNYIWTEKNSNDDLILFEKTVAKQELLNEEFEYIINPKDIINISSEEKVKRKFAIEINENVLKKVIKTHEDLIIEFPKSTLLFRALNNKGSAELDLKNYV